MQNKLFNESLITRFNTLERNIKSKSNSFYDSYLDLLEATINTFLMRIILLMMIQELVAI